MGEATVAPDAVAKERKSMTEIESIQRHIAAKMSDEDFGAKIAEQRDLAMTSIVDVIIRKILSGLGEHADEGGMHAMRAAFVTGHVLGRDYQVGAAMEDTVR